MVCKAFLVIKNIDIIKHSTQKDTQALRPRLPRELKQHAHTLQG